LSRIEIVQKAQRRRRRQLGESADLLARAPLEIRSEQQRTTRLDAQRARERCDGGARAAKQNEAPDSGGERFLNFPLFRSK